ncbi:MAG TPA: type VI secretion system TssO, partial [Niabella sp.]|nr:type VI secretion system TssO [Niabella sp.]
MRPNNIQERNKSFQRFLLFFILTVAIIMVTVFFGIRVPYAENEKLREQIAQMDKENQFRENFSVSMAETQSLLDTVNLDVTRAGLIDGRITQKVQDMDALINKTDL